MSHHRDKAEAWEREENWLGLAIAGAVLGAVGVGVALIWIFSETEAPARLIRVNTLAPFGLVGIAAITFATVVWRGLISGRQADTSLRQLDGLRKQIALTEETNLASLMQKGAELLADESPAKMSAGIASLRAVAESQSAMFNEPSKRLLLDFVMTKGAHGHGWRPIKQAIAAINAAFQSNGQPADVYPGFDEDDELAATDDQYNTDWEIVRGVTSCVYRGGWFNNKTLNMIPRETIFRGVTFSKCHFIDNLGAIDLSNCYFENCSFRALSSRHLEEHTFSNCNFSGAKIDVNDSTPDMRSGKNFYLSSNPPNFIDNPGPPIRLDRTFLAYDELG